MPKLQIESEEADDDRVVEEAFGFWSGAVDKDAG
jgi:hypothetical protein